MDYTEGENVLQCFRLGPLEATAEANRVLIRHAEYSLGINPLKPWMEKGVRNGSRPSQAWSVPWGALQWL